MQMVTAGLDSAALGDGLPLRGGRRTCHGCPWVTGSEGPQGGCREDLGRGGGGRPVRLGNSEVAL